MMASFNEIDGVPATANKWLLTDVLRDEWGFNGFVVSDYTGISEMIDHGFGEDLKDVSAKALKAGLDMDMVAEGFLKTLEESLKEGKITEDDINKACARILRAKFELGLFDNPYKYRDENRAKTEVFTQANRDEARQIAAQSFVLLKNDKNILPLKKSGTIALIGPLADSKENMPGTWSVAASRYPFFNEFDGIVVSGVEKMIKPGKRFYHILLERYDINPSNTVFIDDNIHNIKAAGEIGLHAIHFENPGQLETALLEINAL